MHTKNPDLHLLRCLLALIKEAHVTRAAERMGIGQPTMSATLSRLRTMFGDPILVRTEKGMVPTARALEIAAQMQQAVDLIDGTINDAEPFDSTRAQVNFTLSATESVGFVVIPPLMRRLRECAPNVSVVTHVPDLTRVRQDLEEGQSDLMVAYLRNTAEGLHTSRLSSQRLCVIVSGSHPAIQGALSLEQYVAFPHACYRLSRTSLSTIEYQVEDALAAAGLTRRIAVSLSSTFGAPAVVASSDLIATIPERVARFFAPQLGLQVLPPPLPLEDVEIGMYWHDRMHNNSAHRWLREQIRDVMSQLDRSR